MTPEEPTPRGGDRLIARRRALELLHGADVGDTDPRDGLTGEDPYYARALVEGRGPCHRLISRACTAS